jgi:hypothetical protein
MKVLCKVLVCFSMIFSPLISRLSKLAPLLFVILLNNEAFGQPSQPQLPQYSLGILAGPNLTYATYGNRETQKHFKPGVRPGYSVGVFFKMPMKDRFSFITEASFSQKTRTTNFNENWNNKTIFKMVGGNMALRKSFPLKLKKNTPVNVFLGAGPSIEYLLNAKGRVKVTPGGEAKYDVIFNGTPDSDFRHDYWTGANRWLFGLDLRAGGDAPLLNNQRVYLEVRFTWGQTFLGGKNSSSYMEILGFEDDLKFNMKTLNIVAYYAFDFDTKKSRMGKSTKDKEMKRRR